MRLKTKIALLLIFQLNSFSSDQKIRVLQQSEGISLNTFLKEKSVWFFFKPNCPICHAQVKEFSCLKDLKSVFPVGFLGTEKELWKESRKLGLIKAGFSKIFYGDLEIRNLLKIKGEASPQLLFLDGMTKKRHHLGALSCKEISNFLN